MKHTFFLSISLFFGAILFAQTEIKSEALISNTSSTLLLPVTTITPVAQNTKTVDGSVVRRLHHDSNIIGFKP